MKPPCINCKHYHFYQELIKPDGILCSLTTVPCKRCIHYAKLEDAFEPKDKLYDLWNTYSYVDARNGGAIIYRDETFVVQCSNFAGFLRYNRALTLDEIKRILEPLPDFAAQFPDKEDK